ncbi:Olfactory receptor 14J1, partial [Opisthocomus hoazin]
KVSNGSSVTKFTLLAFADTREMQLLHFWLFLAALLSNSIIIMAIACDHRLHTPMHVFLLKFSVLDLASISTSLPKSMANFLWDTRAISYLGCAAQLFLFSFLLTAEYCLLTVMAYDRYFAICRPLHYGTLLGSRACVHMAAAAWGSGFLYAGLQTANTFSIPLCQGNAVDQFLCLPHLVVVSLFNSTAVFAYLKPPSISSPSLNLVLSFLYSVVPPAVNPLIYSMRNQELKDAL